MKTFFLILITSLCIFYQYYKLSERRRLAYMQACSDFNKRILHTTRIWLSHNYAIPIKETEIAKLGLALIGEDVHFDDERDDRIKEILNLYEEGEDIFLRFYGGKNTNSRKFRKFCIKLKRFKFAWLIKECVFLLHDKENLLQIVKSNIFSGFVHSIYQYDSVLETKRAIKYYDTFDFVQKNHFDMFGVNNYPPDDYRNHETVKDIISSRGVCWDRASSYEIIFWFTLNEVPCDSLDNNAMTSMDSGLFYNLIRYLWIIFTESCLPIIINRKRKWGVQKLLPTIIKDSDKNSVDSETPQSMLLSTYPKKETNTPRQQLEYHQYHEYRIWLEARPDYDEFNIWFDSLLKTKKITRTKFEALLGQKCAEGKYVEAEKLLSDAYRIFQKRKNRTKK